MKYNIALIIIILLASILRFLYLDRIPTGISGDELNFILQAKSIFYSAQNISGTWSPLTLSTIPGNFPQAELPSLLMAPFIGPLPLSLVYSKIPYVICSVGIIILIYLITKHLFNIQIAFATSLILTINPWSVFFGRTAYEAPLSLFFYLIAGYIILKSPGWLSFLSLIPLFLGFYTYMGSKLLLIPYVFFLTAYKFLFEKNWKNRMRIFLIFIIVIGLFLSFLLRLKSLPASQRLNELTTPNSAEIIDGVNYERKSTLLFPYTFIVSNKLTIYTRTLIEKYFKVFSTDFLFLYGEGRGTFSLWFHGYFYYIDALFMLIGLIYLFNRYKKETILLLLLISIAPIATIASSSGTGFAALRSSLIFPLLSILVGGGVIGSLTIFKQQIFRIISFTLISAIYIVSLCNFANIYFLRNPIYNSDSYNLSARILSKYLTEAKILNVPIIVLSESPTGQFNNYLFFTNSFTKDSMAEIRTIYRQPSFMFHSITYTNCKNMEKIPENATIIFESGNTCIPSSGQLLSNRVIASLSDGGAIYKIYNDRLCEKYTLKRYPSQISLSDLNIEALDRKKFCETYITDLSEPSPNELKEIERQNP